jgi:tetratricopeptide (TPR) repeat protein
MMKGATDMAIATFVLTLILSVFELVAPGQRFDTVVRTDFFAGFAGDEARLKKAMALCESILAENPQHAEALVWHGAGLIFEAGRAFRAGDAATGLQLFQSGLKEVNNAVAIAPDDVAVLIPRGAVLLAATATMDPAQARPLVELAVADYEKVLEIQAPYFDGLGDHPRGELLFGLAEGSARLGRLDKAKMYFERLVKDVPASGQTPRAREWLETGSIPKVPGIGCVGCHRQK